MAEELELSADETNKLRWGALLHDVGKLTVPSEILNKAGKPTPTEWSRLQGHPAAGARLAGPLQDWLGDWSHAIDQHHERYGGEGYPEQLRGEEISLAGRIVSVTDAFETMTALRAYKKPMSITDARAELQRCAGSHFDPRVVRAFLGISLGKLRRTMGFAAFAAQLPILGLASRAGAQVQVLAQSASVEAVLAGAAAVALSATIVAPALGVADEAVAVASENSNASTWSSAASQSPNAETVTSDPIAIAGDNSDVPVTGNTAPPANSGGGLPAPSGGESPGPSGSGSSAAGPPSTTAPPAPVTRTYSAAGGSVTVKIANGALSIIATQPAAGYAEERHDTGPDRIEIRFKDGNTEWRIRVELSSGEPTAEITQH